MAWSRRRTASRSPALSERSGSSDARRLWLVPFYCRQPTTLLEHFAHRLEDSFGLRVEMRKPRFDPEVALDPARGQYNSRVVLTHLVEACPPAVDRVLGITSLDLFIPVLSYVFGEALLGGKAATISSHRLDNQLYGLPDDPAVLFERICKEGIHELGHTFGLAHCHDPRCVMTSSTTIDGIDLKSERFCAECDRWLREQAGASRPA